MAITSALANGPIELTSPRGQLEQIPLALLYFDSNQHIKADRWPPYLTMEEPEKEAVRAWLGYLVDEGLIRKGAISAPATAMIVTATDGGAQTNSIVIEFSNVTATTFDAKLTETDVYPGLTPGTVTTVIGTVPHKGTSPGLVFVVESDDPPALPKNAAPAKLAGLTHDLTLLQSDGGTTAFAVRSKADSPDANLTSVEISGVGDAGNPPGTFTLTATWTKTVTAVTPANVADAGKLGYEITVAPPAGGVLAVPAPGIVRLRGGADVTAPVAASATVIANG